MVKIMKQELEVDDILLQCFEVLTSSIFIELFDSSSGEDLTTFPLSMKFLKYILQSDASLSSKPSTPMGSIQFVVSCLHAMVLPKQTSNKLQTLDYDKIPLWKIQFLLIAFNDILFELLPIFFTVHNLSQMQGMDKKYDGHAWCKLVTMNIKKSFGFSFRKARCLGHLRCV